MPEYSVREHTVHRSPNSVHEVLLSQDCSDCCHYIVMKNGEQLIADSVTC